MYKGGNYIWHNGQIVDWDDAKVHVLSHALHYGSSVFEGIRLYKTPNGPKIFRLQDHITRLYNSAKIYRMEIPYSQDDLTKACKDIITQNELNNGAYIRPIAFRGYGEIGLAPKDISTIELSTFDYLFSFCLKFFVILVLTWILSRVMPLLDKPRKRILFIFFLGATFALYNEVDLFWSEIDYLWSSVVIFAESLNWLITAYILSKFIKPRHLGAL